jgi:hypothetical protein
MSQEHAKKPSVTLLMVQKTQGFAANRHKNADHGRCAKEVL